MDAKKNLMLSVYPMLTFWGVKIEWVPLEIGQRFISSGSETYHE